jgi:hypothetical protein
MAPPTIANGRVYLASFGTENVGTGQFCVYGLLPGKNAIKLAAPTGAKASVMGGDLTLTWNTVAGARIYRVLQTSTLEPEAKTVAMGLTTPVFTEPAPERGESVSYMIVAVGVNGTSSTSKAVEVTSPKPRPMRH